MNLFALFLCNKLFILHTKIDLKLRHYSCYCKTIKTTISIIIRQMPSFNMNWNMEITESPPKIRAIKISKNKIVIRVKML